MLVDTAVYVGIDPGATGAIAWRRQERIYGHSWNFDAKKRKDLTLMEMMETLEQIAELAEGTENVFVFMEKVGAFSLGRQACFKLGESMGEWKMACLATGIGFDLVTPQKWQQLVGLPKKKRTYPERKRDLRQLAQQHFPTFKAGINAHTQDAVLLAYACWLSYYSGER